MSLKRPATPRGSDTTDGPTSLARRVAIRALDRLLAGTSSARLSVLIFHRVPRFPDPLLGNEPDATTFATLMAMVREHFSPLSLEEGLRRLAEGTLPARAACVTFDDGYADNLTVAAPILQDLEVPATVFIASGYLDGKCMWNDRLGAAIRNCPGTTIDLTAYGCGVRALGSQVERAELVRDLLNQLKYGPTGFREEVATDLAARYAPDLPSPMLTREQVRALRAMGVEIGGHTVTHPILACLGDHDAYREIAENKEDLEGLLGERLRYFAYPNGIPGLDFTPAHAEMARKIGYAAAVTTHHAVSTATTDRFFLPRFTPWDRTPLRFGVRLLLNRRHIV